MYNANELKRSDKYGGLQERQSRGVAERIGERKDLGGHAPWGGLHFGSGHTGQVVAGVIGRKDVNYDL